MEKILLDDALRSRLNGLNTELELTDEAGRTVGVFLPPDVYKKMLYAYAESCCPFTEEELARMEQEREGARPLAEFWKEMGRQ
jgi:hypothetical protein